MCRWRRGANRVYRFRVELPPGATGAGGAQATQDIRWTAELEPDPSHGTEGASAASDRPGRCAAVLGDFPRRTFVVAGRRVTLLLGPVRLIAADTPLEPARQEPEGPAARRELPGQRSAGRRWHPMAVVGRDRADAPARPDDRRSPSPSGRPADARNPAP